MIELETQRIIALNLIVFFAGCLLGVILGGYASWQDAKRWFSKHPEELNENK
jgi:hypothetical protein